MNDAANIIVLIIASLLFAVVLGIVSIAIRASRRRPAGTTTSVGTDLSVPLKLSLLVVFALVALYHGTILGWFVSDETVDDLGRWLNPVFWIGAIGAISTAIAAFNLGGVLASGGTLLGATQARFGRLLLLMVSAGALYLLFFTEVSVRIIEWDWSATPVGSAAEDTFGERANLVMWGLFVLAALLAYRIVRPKSSRTIVGQPVSIGDQIFMIGGLAIIAALVGAAGLISMAIVDAATGGGVGRMGDRFILAPTGVIDLNPPSTVACGQLEERFGRNGSDGRLGYNYVIVTICPGDGQQYVKVVQTGHAGLDIEFYQSELNQHGRVLRDRSPDEFVSSRAAGATSYFANINPAPFREIGVDHLQFIVRTTP